MRAIAEFTKTTLIGGVLVLIPVYLSVLLLLKALGAIVALVAPITGGLPEALPLREVIAMLLLVAACFACGVLVRTGPGLRAKNAFERAILEKIPGYALIRGLAGKIAGKENEHTFTVVLAEIEDALVPAFLVEDCDELGAVDWQWQSADAWLGKARFGGEKDGQESHRSRQEGHQEAHPDRR